MFTNVKLQQVLFVITVKIFFSVHLFEMTTAFEMTPDLIVQEMIHTSIKQITMMKQITDMLIYHTVCSQEEQPWPEQQAPNIMHHPGLELALDSSLIIEHITRN